ncbi:MAG: F0F1 ATP synthase subunit epsilon [Alphaproteobacteria bacterium]|nr:F0F1 ATP synthase subunit epsilon [Alphaproteobacteria bacterium]
MKLTVTTPLAIIVDAEDVTHLRAEDDTGAFGILAGHADFLTALAVSVVTWRNGQGAEHHIAVHGGMLEVRDGGAVAIATREAVPGDDLHRLESEVLARFRRQIAEEQAARKDAQRLYLAAIRHICHFLRPGQSPVWRGGSAAIQPPGREEQ